MDGSLEMAVGLDDLSVVELDKHDTQALYDTLINRVMTTYYENREKWVEMMKESIKTTSYEFSVERMLDEYYNKMYIK